MTNPIVDILVNRDGMTYSEAESEVDSTREQIIEAIENGDYDEAEDLMMDLGLETDYIFDLI